MLHNITVLKIILTNNVILMKIPSRLRFKRLIRYTIPLYNFLKKHYTYQTNNDILIFKKANKNCT